MKAQPMIDRINSIMKSMDKNLHFTKTHIRALSLSRNIVYDVETYFSTEKVLWDIQEIEDIMKHVIILDDRYKDFYMKCLYPLKIYLMSLEKSDYLEDREIHNFISILFENYLEENQIINYISIF